ncbi:hypothetical protein [Quadrisphaera sp. KR29]|uniref:hypothetical protein n=1 Tax=Quadrisphaera sp. KR29 TaxID=3461391 RepID=UPI0040444E86
MLVAGGPPPTSHAAARAAEAAERTAPAGRPAPPQAPAVPPRPVTDTVELTAGPRDRATPPAGSPAGCPARAEGLQHLAEVAGAGRGAASGALGLDVVV